VQALSTCPTRVIHLLPWHIVIIYIRAHCGCPFPWFGQMCNIMDPSWYYCIILSIFVFYSSFFSPNPGNHWIFLMPPWLCLF
jgi:hypothetical protein